MAAGRYEEVEVSYTHALLELTEDGLCPPGCLVGTENTEGLAVTAVPEA